jgi:talin
MVLLKKKFYFSDQQVDINDPVQLGLLYSQAQEMIIEGKHPITLDEAIIFAALQMQIVYGNHEPDTFKKGFLV